MPSSDMQSALITVLEYMTGIFIFLAGIAVLAVIVIYFIDVNQTTHAIRRNYPVIGRFRYWFEHLGEFFRQYFFAMDPGLIVLQRTWIIPLHSVRHGTCDDRGRFYLLTALFRNWIKTPLIRLK